MNHFIKPLHNEAIMYKNINEKIKLIGENYFVEYVQKHNTADIITFDYCVYINSRTSLSEYYYVFALECGTLVLLHDMYKFYEHLGISHSVIPTELNIVSVHHIKLTNVLILDSKGDIYYSICDEIVPLIIGLNIKKISVRSKFDLVYPIYLLSKNNDLYIIKDINLRKAEYEKLYTKERIVDIYCDQEHDNDYNCATLLTENNNIIWFNQKNYHSIEHNIPTSSKDLFEFNSLNYHTKMHSKYTYGDILYFIKFLSKITEPRKILYHLEPSNFHIIIDHNYNMCTVRCTHIIIDHNYNMCTVRWDWDKQCYNLNKIEGHKYYNGKQNILMDKCKSTILENNIEYNKTNLDRDCRAYLEL